MGTARGYGLSRKCDHTAERTAPLQAPPDLPVRVGGRRMGALAVLVFAAASFLGITTAAPATAAAGDYGRRDAARG